MNTTITRRRFIELGIASTAATSIGPAALAGNDKKPAPKKKKRTFGLGGKLMNFPSSTLLFSTELTGDKYRVPVF